MYNKVMIKNSTLEEQIGELLTRYSLTLAIAESCTGGLISHRVTNVAGSSVYYLGGITAYANETKERLLYVGKQTLEVYGAVSRETILEMARGVRQALGSDIGLSTSGIAGPGGGTPAKPVGLTWIGLSATGIDQAWQHSWPGERLAVKEQTAEAALRHLVGYLAGLKQG